MRRTLIAVSSLALATTGAFVLPSISQAVSGTGVYGVWTASGGIGEVTFPNTVFPSASFTSVDSTQTVAKSQTLIASSPFGLQYGTSRGSTYLLTAVASGQTTGSVTLTFDSAPIAGTWGMALGDVDAENVTVTAKDSAGRRLNMNEFYIESFNTTTGQTDMPTWDPNTETLMGSGVDTQGASAWFTPSGDVKSITLTQRKLSGFPQYALWIATDLEQPAPVASATSSSAVPSASVSASPSPAASPTIPAAPVGKIVICHRTASKQNPYVRITISQDAVISGHDGHNGGLYPTPGWGDIIPPFAGFVGQNWPAGGAILDNECDIPASTSASVAPTASMTASSSTSASGSASASTTAPSTSATASAFATSSATASPTPSTSASSSGSVSATSSASASVSASSSDSSKPAQSATPSPTATTAAEVTEPIAVPFDKPVTITVPDIPNAPADAVISDVQQPKNGDAVVSNGEVIYTPNNGFVGKDEITVIVTERDGSSQAIVVPVVIGEAQTAESLALPASLKIGTNVLTTKPVITNAKQIATVSVSCTPLSRSKLTGDLVYCQVTRKKGGVSVTVNAPMSVKVSVSAPAKGKYLPLNENVSYRVR